MKKRFFALLISFLIIFSCVTPAFASDNDFKLRFNENGEFKILHLCDSQDGYPAKEKTIKYINYMLKIYEPDLVVLGGDNTVGPKETKEDAIKELCTPFVENEVYFTLVFGNHDHEQGVSNEDNLKYYQKHGGKYCLAYDEIPSLHGTATHNLPVYSSDSDKIKFNVWLFDTGAYVYDESNPEKRLGYDSVTEDQIEWYKNRSKELEAQAGHKVPSIVFQHMIVQEIYEVMFPKAIIEIPYLTETYSGVTYSVANPDTSVFKGHLFEPPSPGYYNHGEFDAMLERGDVMAIMVGHDHLNSYEVDYKGIDLINTPGVSHNAYGNEFVRGSRLITIKEDNPNEYTSEVITVNELAFENKEFADAIGITPIEGLLWDMLGDFHLFLKNLSAPIAWLIYMFK